MNIQNKENDKLLLQFIELDSLVTGKNRLEDSLKSLECETQKIETYIKEDIFNYRLAKEFFDRNKELPYMVCLKANKGKCILNKDLIDKNELIVSVRDEFNYEAFNKFMGQYKQEMNIFLVRIKNIYDNIIKSLPWIDFTEYNMLNKYIKLINIIFESENKELGIYYEGLRINIVQAIKEYNFYDGIKKRIGSRECELAKSMTSGINNNDLVNSFTRLQKRNKKLILDMSNKIRNITIDIENEFIKIIPKKYIFNQTFISYAIECLFYGRCKTIGEILNLYENLELHNEINININSVLDSLNDFQAMQFKQLMKLNNTMMDVKDSIFDVEVGLDSLSGNIKEVSNANIRAYNDLLKSNERLIDSNISVNKQIESASLIGAQQLDKLTSIDKGSRKIAKDIIEVKNFTESYRRLKYY